MMKPCQRLSDSGSLSHGRQPEPEVSGCADFRMMRDVERRRGHERTPLVRRSERRAETQEKHEWKMPRYSLPVLNFFSCSLRFLSFIRSQDSIANGALVIARLQLATRIRPVGRNLGPLRFVGAPLSLSRGLGVYESGSAAKTRKSSKSSESSQRHAGSSLPSIQVGSSGDRGKLEVTVLFQT